MKPAIPKGTRDFSPAETARRNYIFSTIASVFRLYGFQQIETPAMENLSTLMGKYGEEGDKLLFKVLNSGDFLQKTSPDDWTQGNANRLATHICEKGLRYDLTVPFARYVVQHHDELQFPFKRYQIQPVWRADRPQKGRYREFYQCDADVVGSDSLMQETELLQIIDEVFARLGIRVSIRINNRKLLAAMAEAIGAPEAMTAITIAIDKLDKIGLPAVEAMLAEEGVSSASIEALRPLLGLQGSNEEKLKGLAGLLPSETGQRGIEECRAVIGAVGMLRNELMLDLTLARGLNYYTGCIFEVKALDVQIGSISGGGRYDNLTGIFGLPGLSGVGISFGADRIYDVLDQLKAWPAETASGTQILFLNFGKEEVAACVALARECRAKGIATEIYPETVKMKKQMAYANARAIPRVALIGEDELAKGIVTLKDMTTGRQTTLPAADFLTELLK